MKTLYKVVSGSRAYGTDLPTSDWDYRGVYMQDKNKILGFGYKEQLSDNKNDTVIYEIRRFCLNITHRFVPYIIFLDQLKF